MWNNRYLLPAALLVAALIGCGGIIEPEASAPYGIVQPAYECWPADSSWIECNQLYCLTPVRGRPPTCYYEKIEHILEGECCRFGRGEEAHCKYEEVAARSLGSSFTSCD